jgi:hypothetical protein
MADDPKAQAPDPSEPVDNPPLGDQPDHDVFDGLVLDENFVRGGAYEPPHRTRAAIGKFKEDQASERYGAPLRPIDGGRKDRKATRRIRAGRQAARSGRRELASWLPLTAALTVVALLLIFRR